MSDSEINVDRLMYEIRETVARQQGGAGHNSSESLNGFSAAGQSWMAHGSLPSLGLQSASPFRPTDQYHINDLLKFHGEEFLRNAYQALLKREPDPIGAAQYLSNLESGRLNKIDVLASLRRSPEGQRAGVKIEGLAWPANIRRLERLPIIGYLLESAIAMARLPRLLRHLRQSEFYLLARQQQMVEHDNQVHRQLAEAVARVSEQAVAGIERAQNQQQAIESLSLQQQGLTERQNEFKDAIEFRWSKVRESVDQSIADLNRQVAEHAQQQLRQQQQLTATIAEQNRQLSDRQEQRAAQAEAQTQQLRAEQKELAQQAEEHIQELRRRQKETQTELIMQERRLNSVLAEARSHSPGTALPSENLLETEVKHLLDPLYAAFEDRFRGDRAEVRNRLQVYLPIVKQAAVVADVLDIGCGRGEWLELLKQQRVQARGLDHNRVFVEQCQESGLDVVEGDALTYLHCLPAKSLNVVTSFHLVEHLEFSQLIELLDEMIRVLRPGGFLILETPNPENFMVGSYSFYADPTHRNPIPSPTLQFLLESRGLERVKVMKLRPWDAAKIEGDTEIIKRFNEYFYGAPDYGIVGWKV